jgi:hypothetical protein
MDGSTDTVNGLAVKALKSFGEQEPQMMVMIEAWTKYAERSEQYPHDDPYGDGGYRAQLVEMRKKVDRLWTHFNGVRDISSAIDDAEDIINYAVFFVRLVRGEDRDGVWPWPPTI